MPDETQPKKEATETQGKPKTGIDPLVLETVFPQAEAVFTSHLKTIGETKDSAIVVLDTNTLLLPYLTGSETLSQIKAIYERLIKEKRLLIPARVAREFAKNRSKKLSDLHKALHDQRSRQQFSAEESYPLLDGVQEYKNLLEIGNKLQVLMKEYGKAFAELIKRFESWEWNDPVSLLYRELLTPDIIVSMTMTEAALHVAHQYRFANNIPPGYKDADKPDGGVGDLIIWQTILEIGKIRDTCVIFVTAEKKADWWDSSNKQQLYPRYELVDEFRRASGGHSLHVITFSRLLEMFGASEMVVAEVRSEELFVPQEVDVSPRAPMGSRIRRAVKEWLLGLDYQVRVPAPNGLFHFLATKNTKTLRIKVMYFSLSDGERALKQWIEDSAKDGQRAALVAVCGRRETMPKLLNILTNTEVQLTWAIGHITSKNTFHVMWSQIT